MDLWHQFVSFFFARYPCHYGACYQTDRTRRSTWVKGPDRTVEGVTAMQERWRRETGGNRERLKDYENVEFEPLVPVIPGATSSTPILAIMPIPLLHSLRLNPTNHILSHLAGVFPGLEQFYRELSVVKEDYHGGDKFEGELGGIF